MIGKPRAHLFDFAETLAELRPNRSMIVQQLVVDKTGLSLPNLAIRRAYQHLDLQSIYSSVKFTTAKDKPAFYLDHNARLLTLLGLSHLISPQDLYSTFIGTERHWHLKTGARDGLVALKEAGCHTAIVSNFDRHLDKIVAQLLPVGIVDELHISQTVGLEKPDPNFYRSYLDKAGLAAADCTYIGDSYVLDYVPARALGMETSLLDELDLFSHLPNQVESLSDYMVKLLHRPQLQSVRKESRHRDPASSRLARR